MSGWFFLGFGAFICALDFLFGLRFSRMTDAQIARIPGNNTRSPDAFRRIGRILMIASPLFLILFAAFAFGLFGPVNGVEPISFN